MKDHNSSDDKLMQLFKEALSNEISPTLADRMRENLRIFRQKLPQHPYMRHLDKARNRTRRLWRPIVRYSLVSILTLLIFASLSQAGRDLISERFWKVFNLVDELGKMRMLGEEEGYNAAIDEAETIEPATVETVRFERFLGISEDGSQIVIEVYNNIAKNWHERVNSTSIWAIDVNTGFYTPLQEGRIVEILPQYEYDNILDYILFLKRPEYHRMQNRKLLLSRNDELWICNLDGTQTCIDTGVAGRWIVASPDKKQLFYHTAKIGDPLRTVIHNVEDHTKHSWDENAPAQAINRESKQTAVATGWGSDGQSIITMVQSQTEDGHLNLSRFERVSVDGQQIFESIEAFNNRGILGDPVFNHHNEFFVHAREHKYFREPHEDLIDIFSVQPLLRLASEIGVGLFWTPDKNRAIIRKVADERGEFSSIVGIFIRKDSQTATLDLTQLDPGFEHIGPSSSGFVSDQGNVISPNSRYLTVLSYDEWLFGILDLETFEVVQLFDSILPNLAVWSPDSRLIAARARRNIESEFTEYVFNIETGEVTDLAFEHMRPLVWLDDETIVWINRWGGQDPAKVGPFGLTITNVGTGEIEVLEIQE